MGGKSQPSNNQMVDFERQQAAVAAQKEAERQQRLQSGTSAINQIFDSGQFGDDFYNKYNQANLDYTLPQLQSQYDEAKRKLTFDTARAGTLRSTETARAQGLLDTQDLTNEAALRAQADQQTAALRSTIAGNKQTAINQLYATEDPTMATNTATTLAQQGAIATPNINPLGELFKPLAVGGASYLSSYVPNYNMAQGINMAAQNKLVQGT